MQLFFSPFNYVKLKNQQHLFFVIQHRLLVCLLQLYVISVLMRVIFKELFHRLAKNKQCPSPVWAIVEWLRVIWVWSSLKISHIKQIKTSHRSTYANVRNWKSECECIRNKTKTNKWLNKTESDLRRKWKRRRNEQTAYRIKTLNQGMKY